MGRRQNIRGKPEKGLPTKAEKEQYLLEATTFAATVAEEMNEPDAEKLYCPVYRVKPCGCVQRYITGGDVGDFPSEAASKRVNDLLRLHREAKKLKSRIVTDSNDKGDKRLLRMLRAEGFERFILANRLQVRHEMGICERACQRLLFYSNNFLHKDLKTGPSKGPRIKRMGGKRQVTKNALRPISELPKEFCCTEHCVRYVQMRFKQLETWRKTAQASKQGVRKVVAEMLNSNVQTCCHKFITLVTGCSFSLISKVKEQQKRKEGNSSLIQYKGKIPCHESSSKNRIKSEPPLNGDNSVSTAELVTEGHNEFSGTMEHHGIDLLNSAHHDLHIPHPSSHSTVHDGNFQMDQSAFSHYLQSRAEFWQPLGLDCPTQTLQAITPNRVINVMDNGESPPQSQTLTVLGPAATSPSTYAASHPHPSVIISMPETLQGQAISVITSPSSLEPLTSSPFGNVVIFPESTIYVPTPTMTGIM